MGLLPPADRQPLLESLLQNPRKNRLDHDPSTEWVESHEFQREIQGGPQDETRVAAREARRWRNTTTSVLHIALLPPFNVELKR